MPRTTGITYRAALIGCGSMGSFYMDEMVDYPGRQPLPVGHAEVLRTHPRANLVAGADPDAERLAAFGRRWEVARLYRDHREMLENERPEIVSVASPPALHAQHVIDCAEQGVRGVFCEKPLATSLGEADAVRAACGRHGAALCVNHLLRGDPWHRQARRLIQEGAIGDLLTVTTSWSGRLFLTGTHRFDLSNFFTGEDATAWLIGHTEEPTSHQTVVPTQRGVDVGGTAYVVYAGGVRAFFNGRDGSPVTRIDLMGSRGMIGLDSNEAQLWRADTTSRFRRLLRYPFPQMMHYTAPMVFLLDDLIAAMESGREPISGGAVARHALEQILATHFSALHGNCRVDFPFTDTEMRPPYRWAGKGGETAYEPPGLGESR